MKQTMKQLMKYTALVALVFALASCGKDDEMSNATVNFGFVGNSSVTGVPAGRIEANTLEFTDGTIRLRSIQFEVETDDGDSIEAEIERIIEIDFATGETTPNLESLVFPIGTFQEVRVELEILDENDIPSVVINGTFTDANNQTHPIRFEFNSGETFEVEKEGNITIGEGAQVLAEVTFDPGVWFAGVSSEQLSAATKTGGVIVISETSNSEIFDTVADGLDLATEIEISL